MDPHKFGYAPKGSSLLLWKDKMLKHYQYSIAAEWTGGIYASVSLPGSRVGSQIVGTWCSLLYHGMNGYRNAADEIIATALSFKERLRADNDFVVIGDPSLNVVAFYHKVFSVSQINKYLKCTDGT